jgi:hypothetical protein
MRTTVTLDADTEALLRKVMEERGISFKVALNDAVRAGLTDRSRRGDPYRVPTAALGLPAVNLDRAIQVAADLEDEELLRKQRTGR